MLLTSMGDSVNVISGLISSVGFPIFAFLLMVKTNHDQSQEHKKEVEQMQISFNERNKEMTEANKEDQRLMREVIEKNTQALEKLSERLRGE